MGEAIKTVGELAGICGHDGTDWLKALIDAAGHLQVDLVDSPTITVIPGASNVIRGFEGIAEEALSETNLPAGSSVLTGTTVPTGEIHVITQMMLLYVGAAPTRMYTDSPGLAGTIVTWNIESPTPSRSYTQSVNIYLQAGDAMRAYIVGATAGDAFYFRYAGYKFSAP